MDTFEAAISLTRILSNATLASSIVLIEEGATVDQSLVGQIFQESVSDSSGLGSKLNNLKMSVLSFPSSMSNDQAKQRALIELQKQNFGATGHVRCGRVRATGKRYVFALGTFPEAGRASPQAPMRSQMPPAAPNPPPPKAPIRPTSPVSRTTHAPSAGQGLSLQTAYVVKAVPEEYQILERSKCGSCGGAFTRQGMERQSFVMYRNRAHDVLRVTCSRCGARTDIYFDFTETLPKDDQARLPEMKRIKGEVPDPPPRDIFAWAIERKKQTSAEDATAKGVAQVLGSLFNVSALREASKRGGHDFQNHPPIMTRSHGYAFTFYSSKVSNSEYLKISPSNSPTDPPRPYENLRKDFGAHTVRLLQDFFEATSLAERDGRSTDWISMVGIQSCEELDTAEFAFALQQGIVNRLMLVWDDAFAGVSQPAMEDLLKQLLLLCAGLRRQVRQAGIPCADKVELAVKMPGAEEQWATVDLPE